MCKVNNVERESKCITISRSKGIMYSRKMTLKEWPNGEINLKKTIQFTYGKPNIK